jgi:hypothetical protein
MDSDAYAKFDLKFDSLLHDTASHVNDFCRNLPAESCSGESKSPHCIVLISPLGMSKDPVIPTMFVLGSFYPHYAYLKILLSLLLLYCQQILLSSLCISEDLVILTMCLMSTHSVILPMHIWRSCYPYYELYVNRSCYRYNAYRKILLPYYMLYVNRSCNRYYTYLKILLSLLCA